MSTKTSCLCANVLLTGLTVVVFLVPAVNAQTIDWITQLGGPEVDSYSAIARDDAGFFYAAGFKQSSDENQSRLTKFDSEGQAIWQRLSDFEHGIDVAVDADGNVVLAGLSWSFSQNVWEGFVAKYDTDGTKLWQTSFSTDSELTQTVQGVAVSASGSIFVAGYTPGVVGEQNFGFEDGFVIKLNSAGTVVDTLQFGTVNSDYIHDISIGTTDDELYLTGKTWGSWGGVNQGSLDVVIANLKQDLSVDWIRQIGSSDKDSATAINIDASGRPVIAGSTYGSLAGDYAGDGDMFAAKFDNDGNQLWIRQLGTPDADYVNDVSIGLNGRVHLGGVHGGPSDDYAFIQVLRSDGVPLWQRRLNSEGDFERVEGIFATPVGEDPAIFVVGVTNGNLGGSNQGFSDAFFGKISYGTIVDSTETNIVRGTEVDGTESNLELSDDVYWNFNPGLTLSDAEPPVWLRQETLLSFEDPLELIFALETHANSVGLTQEIEVFNWENNQYESVSQTNVAFNNDSNVFVDLSGLNNQYVEPQFDGSGRVLWQANCRATGPILVFPWEYSIDRLSCDVQ